MTEPTHADPRGDQPELLPGLVRAQARTARERAHAPEAGDAPVQQPVARVLVDVPLAHLDKPFDYAVPARLADAARPGTRVKMRFAGQDVDGYLLERADDTDHAGSLSPLRRVVSPEPVLAPEIGELTVEVARRYAGTRSDVLRLAIPPRHATTEKESSGPPPQPPPYRSSDVWADHTHGEAFADGLAAGRSPRAVWNAAPGADWPAMLAEAAAATYSSGRGVLICVPDGKDVHRVDSALEARLGPGHHVALRADAGPSRRYRDFLAVRRGARRVVVGTRAAAFAPVRGLGLVAIWDDGDDLHAEPRAPYPHAREVLLTRAEGEGAAALVGGFARTVEGEYLLRSGWAREITAPRELVRRRVRVAIAGGSEHDLARDPFARSVRMPTQVRDTIRRGLQSGPVLVQTPRSGYAASLACERCRTPARCTATTSSAAATASTPTTPSTATTATTPSTPTTATPARSATTGTGTGGTACSGPLQLTAPTAPPSCRWCGSADPAWACPHCGHRGLRAPVVGDLRTAEELGRAFPGVVVRSSSGDDVLAEVPDGQAIVVATPGAEPVAPRGYSAVVLLDTWLALARTDLRTDEEALRRWLGAAGMVAEGAEVLAVGDPAHPALQALVRWDPAGFAARELAERSAAHLPPASRLATITGEEGAVGEALKLLDAPPYAEVLGPAPTPAPDQSRVVVRVPRAHGADLAKALGDLQRTRSARKLPAVRVQVDPVSL